MVNEYLETNVSGIYAAGDVANYQDMLFEKRRRVEHWDNAVSQGQHCARSLMGQREPFKHVPYFFSDVFDLSYEYWGDSSGADQIVHRGDFSSSSFSVWWLEQQRVVAAFTMNRPDEERELAPPPRGSLGLHGPFLPPPLITGTTLRLSKAHCLLQKTILS